MSVHLALACCCPDAFVATVTFAQRGHRQITSYLSLPPDDDAHDADEHEEENYGGCGNDNDDLSAEQRFRASVCEMS